MYITTKAIVLNKVKYGDNSIIATLYLEECGTLSFMVKNFFSKKNKTSQAFFQPLNILKITFNHQPKQKIHFIKEFELAYHYQIIPFDIAKNSLLIFLNEVIYKILKHAENDASLFYFIESQLLTLDQKESNASSFHLHFLVQLMQEIGIQPINNYSIHEPYFNIAEASFTSQTNLAFPLSLEESALFSHILNQEEIIINKVLRNRILDLIIAYISFHNEDFHAIESLPILRQLFQ